MTCRYGALVCTHAQCQEEGAAPASELTVYVAGPYSNPDPLGVEINVCKAMDAGDELEDAGLVAFIPHLSHFRHCRRFRDYEHWIRVDLVWLRKCDALLRLEGESKGSDGEVEEAQRIGVPVFYRVEDVKRWAAAVLAARAA